MNMWRTQLRTSRNWSDRKDMHWRRWWRLHFHQTTDQSWMQATNCM
jgi:hypothetical protein